MYVSFLLHVSFIFDCLVYFFLIFIILYYVYDFIINKINKLTREGAIRAADDREVWRKIVCDTTNPRIEDG